MSTRTEYKREYDRRRRDDFNERWRNHVTCSKCGVHPYYEGHKMGINFHHLDPATKSFTIRYSDCKGKTVIEILMEIAKCMPLCHGCHTRLHKDQGKGSAMDRKAYMMAWEAEHRDEVNAKRRAYNAEHREEYNAYKRARYHATKKSLTGRQVL